MEKQAKMAAPALPTADTAHHPLTVCVSRSLWRALCDGRHYTNPYELLVEGNEDAVRPLILASDAGLTGGASATLAAGLADGASEYERFAALCTAIPLWAGHPLYAAMHGVLARVTGCELPLTADNAPLIWRYVAEQTAAAPLDRQSVLARLGVGEIRPCCPLRDEPMTSGGAPVCSTQVPDGALFVHPLLCLDERSAFVYPDPEVMATNLSSRIRAYAEAGGDRVVCFLPDGWHFQRPHPYGAGAVMKKATAGGKVTDDERDLLYAQLLRVVGQACVREGVALSLCGGGSDEAGRLVTYLTSCGGHRTLRYMPAVAGEVGGLLGIPGVSFGLPLTAGDTPRTIADKLAAHAARAPLGALAWLDIVADHITDVWTLIEAHRVLRDQLEAWGQVGAATDDPEVWCALSARL